MIQSDHNIVINKRFVNPKLLIPIILIFIPLLVSGSDSLLTFSIHKRGGEGEADGCRRKMLKSCCANQKWGKQCCKEKEQKREKRKNS